MSISFWTPFKVGLLAIVVVVALSIGLAAVTGKSWKESESYLVYGIFDDVTGLRRRSRVQIAGIEVGQIESIGLVGHQARVTLRIDENVRLYSNARLSKRAEGLIGDMAIDVFPGSDDYPVLRDGDLIENVVSSGSIEQVFEVLGDITTDIQGVTATLREILGPETSDALHTMVTDFSSLTETVNSTILDSSQKISNILTLFEGLTSEIHDVTVGERRTITGILHSIERFSAQVEDVLATIQGVIGSGEDDLREGVHDLRETAARINSALDEVAVITGQVGEVTDKMSSGEGTIGRLILEDGLYNQIESTISSASGFVDRLMSLETQVFVASELYARHRSARTMASIRLIPNANKWYSIGLVDPVFPVVERVHVTEIVDGVPVTTDTWQSVRAWQVHAYMAHRWFFSNWSLTGRFGLLEGAGGVAGDLGFLSDHLRFSVEAFDFSNVEKRFPRLRMLASWSFFDHLYLSGGVDDFLNSRTEPAVGIESIDPRDFFIGGGFFFTDEDLKAIITTVGVPTR